MINRIKVLLFLHRTDYSWSLSPPGLCFRISHSFKCSLVITRKITVTEIERVLPLYQLEEYLCRVHVELGHRRRDAMVARIASDKVWIEDVRACCQKYINKCFQCFTSHRLKPDNVVTQPIVAQKALERMQLDFIKLAEDKHGNKHLLTLIDCYSKKCWIRGM